MSQARGSTMKDPSCEAKEEKEGKKEKRRKEMKRKTQMLVR